MYTDVKIFNNNEFGSVRTIEHNGKVLFCGKDIAIALGYKEPSKAIREHCKGVSKIDTPTKGGIQETSFIPEGDVYRLIIGSRLPTAQKFESWVFDEVLPSIRSNGGYINNQESLTPEEIIAKALVVANNVIEKQKLELENKNRKILEDAPKVDFFNTVASSDEAKSMLEVSKLVGIGRNKLFDRLRKEGILNSNNLPYQEYMNRGYFKVIEKPYIDGYGETRISLVTLVYQKGLDFIVNKILGCKAE